MEAKFPLPEDGVVFHDHTKDGLFAIGVRLQHGPQTELMQEYGVAYMGLLRINRISDGKLLHEEIVPLSENSVHGSGPSGEEVTYWSSLIDKAEAELDD